ncbi:hypothetical protein [Candidimonas nitroreducens]|uniref:Uncharacterized protein n=1 Tax=Candidimonas nitroreducens TaxID=683354 RepID=A0A225M360_9BURK|nr:hypothetical protein [Candidimonas nitroreducens]OWT53389.1 hypothetical protein CEY11_24865 [Candidimonas nitroreducens]
MQFPHTLHKRAGLNATDIAALYDVTRTTGFRWLRGGGVNRFLVDRVTKTTTAVQAAVDAGILPDGDVTGMPPARRIVAIRAALRGRRMTK